MKQLIAAATILFFMPMLQGCGLVALFIPPLQPYLAQIDGEAELAKAQFSKQVQIQDANGKYESAKLLAQAEVERAKGVAQANQIIGNSLKDNESYLRWLYIEGLKERTGAETIYVPTEAGLPILEAGKKGKQ